MEEGFQAEETATQKSESPEAGTVFAMFKE